MGSVDFRKKKLLIPRRTNRLIFFECFDAGCCLFEFSNFPRRANQPFRDNRRQMATVEAFFFHNFVGLDRGDFRPRQNHVTLLSRNMAFTLWTLFEATLLCLNAVCILHEERFLTKGEFFFINTSLGGM